MSDKIDVPLRIKILENQLNQTIEKMWKIFNWTSTIFLAIIGGLFILSRKLSSKCTAGSTSTFLDANEKLILGGVVIVALIYSGYWLHQNSKKARLLRSMLSAITDLIEIEVSENKTHKLYVKPKEFFIYIGYIHVTIILGIITLLAIFIIK